MKINKKVFASAALVLFLGIGLLITAPVLAEGGALENLENVGTAAGLSGQSNLIALIGNIVKVLLGIMGVVFVCLIIYAGYLWMIAAGDSEKVKKAQSIIIAAIMGAVITFAAYAISEFVIENLNAAATETETTG